MKLTLKMALDELTPYGENAPNHLIERLEWTFSDRYYKRRFLGLMACNRLGNPNFLIERKWYMSYPGLLDLFKYETLSTQKKYELFIEYLDGRKDYCYFDDIEEEGLRLEHLDVLLTHADDFNEEFLLNRLQQLSTYIKKHKIKVYFEFHRGPIQDESLLLLFEIL